MSLIKKQIVFSVVVLLFSYDAFAQVAKNIIVEHFTNTVCSICSNRNPGFYENLNKQEGVLHISYHPSRPYSSCVLHQHNEEENDGRTKYFNVYGGTPRLVIQGEVIAGGADYTKNALFEPYQTQTSPVSIAIEQTIIENYGMEVNIAIKNEMELDSTDMKIFAGIAEKVVEYNAPNGEKQHFDVFRKAYTAVEGNPIRLEKTEGSIAELSYIVVPDESWVLDQIFCYVILQTEWISMDIKNQADVAMHTLSKGLYFIQIEQNGKHFQHKVFKK